MVDVAVRGLTVEYAAGDYVVRPLDGLDLEARSGELVILLGPSGSGKTTLLSCLAGILTPTAGSIRVGDSEVADLNGARLDEYRRRTVGVVFQGFNLIDSLSARENVAVPLRLVGQRGATVRKRADELLESVGLAERVKHRPAQLSGGQQQRVAIARALALDPPVLLADEPTAHLDHVQVEGVMTLLRQLARPGRVVITSTHDDRLLTLADRVVELAPKVVAPMRQSGPVRLSHDQLLFDQGDRSDLVYVIETGEIEIFRIDASGTEHRISVIGPGHHFGEMGPLLSLPRSAAARARGEVLLQSYTATEFRNRAGTEVRRSMRGEAPAVPPAPASPVRKEPAMLVEHVADFEHALSAYNHGFWSEVADYLPADLVLSDEEAAVVTRGRASGLAHLQQLRSGRATGPVTVASLETIGHTLLATLVAREQPTGVPPLCWHVECDFDLDGLIHEVRVRRAALPEQAGVTLREPRQATAQD